MKILNRQPIRWDAHGCPPFKIGSDFSFLRRYKNSDVQFISLNVGFDLTHQQDAIELMKYINSWVKIHNNEFAIIKNTNELIENCIQNKLCIAFDIEGINLLNDQIEMISVFYDLGVRQIVFAYNQNNASGAGCFDSRTGLTVFGKQLVDECNRIGMVIDCSHVGYRTSLDIIERSTHPVVFSHSNPATLVNHPRNITDEQILACAKKNGVIGINGVGIFLGENDVSTSKIIEHIDYAVNLVGSQHIGIGLDCVFNPEEVQDLARNNKDTFPPELGFSHVNVAQPEQFIEINEQLLKRGYSDIDINNILGENFFRIASTVWKK